MTINELVVAMELLKISENAVIKVNVGWDAGECDVDTIWYSEKENKVILTKKYVYEKDITDDYVEYSLEDYLKKNNKDK